MEESEDHFVFLSTYDCVFLFLSAFFSACGHQRPAHSPSFPLSLASFQENRCPPPLPPKPQPSLSANLCHANSRRTTLRNVTLLSLIKALFKHLNQCVRLEPSMCFSGLPVASGLAHGHELLLFPRCQKKKKRLSRCADRVPHIPCRH